MPELPEPPSLVADRIDACRLQGWTVTTRDMWTVLDPPGRPERVQGWKLHVSATVWSAPEVLRRCLDLIAATATSFKFASTASDVQRLNDFQCPRGQSGKFITVYPLERATLTELAERLHEATAGLPGPVILSDRAYRPGSLVHYRYGAFDGFRVLGNDGTYRDCVLDPETNPVEDKRPAVFDPPAWAELPFAADPPAAGGGGGVLLNDRYEVRGAIRHANKGGVYRALDRTTGATVLVKEARPHVGTDAEGRDARDYLRHEAAVLRHLAGLGVVPEFVDEFEQGGHAFLVEQFLDGRTLAEAGGASVRGADAPPEPADTLGVALRLARILKAVHGRGVVLRDLSPNNVLALPDGTLRLIDLELSARRTGPGSADPVHGDGHGTPGFSAPEQFRNAPVDAAADLYSLGALVLFHATRRNPRLALDEPPHRTLEERVAGRTVAPAVPETLADPVRRIVTGLLRAEPGERMPLAEVIALARQTPPAGVTTDRPDDPDGWWEQLVGGVLGHLAATVTPDTGPRLWREYGLGETAEPCAVQYGSGGVLAMLSGLRRHGVGGTIGGLVDELAPVVLRRLTRHLDTVPHRLPGLHFGFAGTAWALFEAGAAFDRPDLTDRAVALAEGLPTVWPNPDQTHGLAGLGTALLHLAAATGRPGTARRAVRCAEAILAARDPGATAWTVPAGFDSTLAGHRSYGYAHGTAGIGAFLLAAAAHTGRDDFAAAARDCADELLAVAVRRGDAAYWTDRPGSASMHTWWCNGSAGVGTFLARAYTYTGDARYGEGAVAAGRAVVATRCDVGTSHCHGLAGSGEFLLDLAAATGLDEFADWARHLAAQLWAERVYRDGRPVLMNESGHEFSAAYGVGAAGPLAFLTRLRHGGDRLFHPPVTAPDPGAVFAAPSPTDRSTEEVKMQ
ncbi:class IV lanthionine synthetase LanL [Dactylosporangium sp. NPDC049742]|uniref:class IV lanthionine synthetase LanL n=1 Tax=Dactylosporangium sp. NPDC049742 TaxID=3154737 RepID=UPI00342C2F6D